MPRSSLLARLRSSREVPIVAVVAGPGYGKTSLLAQWAKADRRPFAWVSLDERDNDPAVLLWYLASAIDRLEPIEGRPWGNPSTLGPSDDASVPRVGDLLATMRRPFVLALDDVHLVDNPECRLAIAALSRRIPAGSQLAIADREKAPLPVARLRTTGDVLEIGSSDLKMDDDEARALFLGCGLDLRDEDVAQLTRRTEGWPVGLYLAAHSLKDGPGVETGVAAFAGDDRIVADYLWLEFLSRLPEDDLRFLTRTSVLERMSGPLCDEVLGAQDSATRLDALERSNLFLVPVDRQRTWYRYHHLFQDLLRAQLATSDPEEGLRMRRRAASWCEANGLPDVAVGYLQAAGDADGAARLVARLGRTPMYFGERIGTLERWIGWFEDRGLIERYPPVAVIGAFTMAFAGRPATAERWADAADRAAWDLTTGGNDPFDAWLALLRAFLCRDGPEQMRLDAESALKLMPAGSPWRASALYLLGVSLVLTGEVEAGDEVLTDAMELAAGEGAGVLASLGWAERAAIAIGRGRWEDAATFVDEALTAVREHRLEGHVTSALTFAIRARVAAHHGDVAGATLELRDAQRVRPRLTRALSVYAVQTLLELSRAHVAVADPAGARVLMREVADLLHRRPHVGNLRAEYTELHARLQAIREGAPGASTLTAAELRLLPYLPTHLTFREIGDQLRISPHTVKTQAISIYRKLAVSTRADAVEASRRLGLLA